MNLSEIQGEKDLLESKFSTYRSSRSSRERKNLRKEN